MHKRPPQRKRLLLLIPGVTNHTPASLLTTDGQTTDKPTVCSDPVSEFPVNQDDEF